MPLGKLFLLFGSFLFRNWSSSGSSKDAMRWDGDYYRIAMSCVRACVRARACVCDLLFNRVLRQQGGWPSRPPPPHVWLSLLSGGLKSGPMEMRTDPFIRHRSQSQRGTSLGLAALASRGAQPAGLEGG